MHTIFLVRHGENPANLRHEFSCRHVDYSLTERGRLQAAQTAAFFAGRAIDQVWTSPLRRAYETAAPIANVLGLPLVVVDEFREIDVGELELEPPTPANWRFHDHIMAEWRAGRHEAIFPGGESYDMVLDRIQSGFRRILHSTPQQASVVVTHGGIVAATIRDICATGAVEMVNRVEQRNCAVTEIALALEGGLPRGHLASWAVCEHLAGAALAELSPSPGKLP